MLRVMQPAVEVPQASGENYGLAASGANPLHIALGGEGSCDPPLPQGVSRPFFVLSIDPFLPPKRIPSGLARGRIFVIDERWPA